MTNGRRLTPAAVPFWACRPGGALRICHGRALDPATQPRRVCGAILLYQMIRRSLDDPAVTAQPQIFANHLCPLVLVTKHDAVRRREHLEQFEVEIRMSLKRS